MDFPSAPQHGGHRGLAAGSALADGQEELLVTLRPSSTLTALTALWSDKDIVKPPWATTFRYITFRYNRSLFREEF